MNGFRQYGLRVQSDYRDVDMSALASVNDVVTIRGDRELRLRGCMVLRMDVVADALLTLVVERDAFVQLISVVHPGVALTVEQRGDIAGVLRMDRTTTLHTGASLTDVTTGLVSGRADIGVRVFHEGTSSSRLLGKFAVTGKGALIARGAVVMLPTAAGSDGFERLDALLLDPTAKADVLPTMDAQTDDVRCKHGATVGSMDEEARFYLCARGLDLREAKEAFARGFLHDICLYGRT